MSLYCNWCENAHDYRVCVVGKAYGSHLLSCVRCWAQPEELRRSVLQLVFYHHVEREIDCKDYAILEFYSSLSLGDFGTANCSQFFSLYIIKAVQQ